jgi:hypothetical protein
MTGFDAMHRIRLTIAITVLAFLPWGAAASDRVALVFGMASYETVPPLRNTLNDARAISDTLAAIGFDVTLLLDVGRDEMRTALDDFSFRSETADLALIYFAGHAIEVSGENFFLPVDAAVASNRDVQARSLTLRDFLGAVDRARKMRIVILDSCRDNPFGDGIETTAGTTTSEGGTTATRGAGGGLAPADPDRGTLVAYAARDGQVAFDGTGQNSPYARALIDMLPQKDLEISLLFRQVRDAVLKSTGNLQEPYTYGSLTGVPFYLAGASSETPAVAADDRRVAWSGIRPEQTLQLAALAETGDTRSLLGLAYMALNPDGSDFDPKKAFTLLTRAAEAGDAEAQYELGKLYETGLGVPADPERALALFRAAADQDFADAINDLGFLTYQGGLGVSADPAAALALFERAADLRHPQAMFNYAALIDDGIVPERGPETAARYLYDALRTGSQDVLDILSDRPAMFTDATRRELQRVLAENAFYQGSIDGDFGQGTQRGLRRAFGLEQ